MSIMLLTAQSMSKNMRRHKMFDKRMYFLTAHHIRKPKQIETRKSLECDEVRSKYGSEGCIKI